MSGGVVLVYKLLFKTLFNILIYRHSCKVPTNYRNKMWCLTELTGGWKDSELEKKKEHSQKALIKISHFPE